MKDFQYYQMYKKGEDVPSSKLTEVDVREILSRHVAGESAKGIAKSYPQVCHQTVNEVCRGRQWYEIWMEYHPEQEPVYE